VVHGWWYAYSVQRMAMKEILTHFEPLLYYKLE